MINVAIIEDNVQYRKTLSAILQLDKSLRLIHELSDCSNIIELFRKRMPHVVIMDIDLPENSGIEIVWELKQQLHDVKILILTVFEDEEKIFGAIKAGANGYMLRKDPPQKIIESIHAVSRGESAVNGLIASKVLGYFHREQKKTQGALASSSVTHREKEILQFLVKGLSYKEIAALCRISTQTLNTHIKKLYQKLDVHSRAELAARFGNTI